MISRICCSFFLLTQFKIELIVLLDFLLEGLKLVDVVLLLGGVVLETVLSQLSDLHAVVLKLEKSQVSIYSVRKILKKALALEQLTSSFKFLSSLSSLLTCEFEILRPSMHERLYKV